MELGIYTFAELSPDPVTGETISPTQRMSNLMEEVQLADEVGLDVFAMGEHHRKDFVVSAPAVALAAASQRTKKIKLSSAVTVLSSDDPVRVYEQFSSLDLLSGGRAEIMAGRGSFIESFPLFGYSLEDYDELFSEKLDLLVKINKSEIVNSNGKLRPSISGLGVYPRAERPLPIWVAVGGTPDSVIRAGKMGLPMGLAIIGGAPKRFARLVDLYRSTLTDSGFDADAIPFGLNIHGFVGDTSQVAIDAFWPPYADVMARLGRERGWPPPSHEHYLSEISPEGALFVGSPAEVVDKILSSYELFGQSRILVQMSVGTMPHHQIMRSIELYGTRVAPEVRKALSLD